MNKLVKGVIAILLSLSILFVILVIKESYPYIKAQKNYSVLQSEFIKSVDYKTSDMRTIDFDKLQELYPDVIGWIYIPGTQIDYPICKGNNDQFYLDHNPAGEYNILGAIFVTSETAEELSDAHTIIYGHNMRSGQMFGELSNYISSDFHNEHSEVYIYTPEKIVVCSVYNSYYCIAGDVNYQIGLELGSIQYAAWLKETTRNTNYDLSRLNLDTNMQVYTLSTCTDSGASDSRFIVNCIVKQIYGVN